MSWITECAECGLKPGDLPHGVAEDEFAQVDGDWLCQRCSL